MRTEQRSPLIIRRSKILFPSTKKFRTSRRERERIGRNGKQGFPARLARMETRHFRISRRNSPGTGVREKNEKNVGI